MMNLEDCRGFCLANKIPGNNIPRIPLGFLFGKQIPTDLPSSACQWAAAAVAVTQWAAGPSLFFGPLQLVTNKYVNPRDVTEFK
jgi:hypothetical protein